MTNHLQQSPWCFLRLGYIILRMEAQVREQKSIRRQIWIPFQRVFFPTNRVLQHLRTFRERFELRTVSKMLTFPWQEALFARWNITASVLSWQHLFCHFPMFHTDYFSLKIIGLQALWCCFQVHHVTSFSRIQLFPSFEFSRSCTRVSRVTNNDKMNHRACFCFRWLFTNHLKTEGKTTTKAYWK